MSVVKEKMKKVIESFPGDATYGEIMRELIFDEMINCGLEDLREGRTISNEDMGKRIRIWK